MSSCKSFTKDPNARLDYTIRWSKWLRPGDSIASVTWEITSGDGELTIGSGAYAPSLEVTLATVWLEDGTAGADYTVRARATTTRGRIDDRSFVVQVRER